MNPRTLSQTPARLALPSRLATSGAATSPAWRCKSASVRSLLRTTGSGRATPAPLRQHWSQCSRATVLDRPWSTRQAVLFLVIGELLDKIAPNSDYSAQVAAERHVLTRGY